MGEIERRLNDVTAPFAAGPRSAAAGPAVPPIPAEVHWLSDDELADRIQHIFKRQARRRGIDLS
jgi:hypothetical protein